MTAASHVSVVAGQVDDSNLCSFGMDVNLM